MTCEFCVHPQSRDLCEICVVKPSQCYKVHPGSDAWEPSEGRAGSPANYGAPQPPDLLHLVWSGCDVHSLSVPERGGAPASGQKEERVCMARLLFLSQHIFQGILDVFDGVCISVIFRAAKLAVWGGSSRDLGRASWPLFSSGNNCISLINEYYWRKHTYVMGALISMVCCLSHTARALRDGPLQEASPGAEASTRQGQGRSLAMGTARRVTVMLLKIAFYCS